MSWNTMKTIMKKILTASGFMEKARIQTTERPEVVPSAATPQGPPAHRTWSFLLFALSAESKKKIHHCALPPGRSPYGLEAAALWRAFDSYLSIHGSYLHDIHYRIYERLYDVGPVAVSTNLRTAFSGYAGNNLT